MAEWEAIGPLMPQPGRRGRPRGVEFGEVINAAPYPVRSGRGWRMLPAHFELRYRLVGGRDGWFRELARRFLFRTIDDGALTVDRERAGRGASPWACADDGQSVSAPHGNLRGYDASLISWRANATSLLTRTGGFAGPPDLGRHQRLRLAHGIPDAIRKRWPLAKQIFGRRSLARSS